MPGLLSRRRTMQPDAYDVDSTSRLAIVELRLLSQRTRDKAVAGWLIDASNAPNAGQRFRLLARVAEAMCPETPESQAAQQSDAST